MPIAEALALAKQIAEALEAAHDKGIIHRDLKPGNVKVTPAGVVKVLDFGLAKAVERSVAVGPDSPTLTMRATEAGLILGTAGYMSPEQAAGKPLDWRADIWSFGVVFYELLTGKRLFDGETVTHTLAGVVLAPIDFSVLPMDTPPGVRRLLRRCLDRNLKMRLRDIGEARVALERSGETEETEGPLPGGRGSVAARRSRLGSGAARLDCRRARTRPHRRRPRLVQRHPPRAAPPSHSPQRRGRARHAAGKGRRYQRQRWKRARAFA